MSNDQMSTPLESFIVEAGPMSFQVTGCGDGDDLALCLHGFPELGYSWRHQLPVLADLGYRAWAPDLRGYGGTTRPTRVADYAIEHLLDDVDRLIDASGARSVTLIAHDWGAVIAWWYAIQQRQELDRLVIMNVPHPAVATHMMPRSPRQALRSSYMVFFQVPGLPERLLAARHAEQIATVLRSTAVNPDAFTDADLDLYRHAASQPGALTAMLSYYRAYLRGGGLLRMSRKGHPVIEVPTLMIWGEQDRFLGQELTVGTEAHVSDLTLRRIPDSSHWVQQDTPDTVNAMLAAFLQGEPVP